MRNMLGGISRNTIGPRSHGSCTTPPLAPAPPKYGLNQLQKALVMIAKDTRIFTERQALVRPKNVFKAEGCGSGFRVGVSRVQAIVRPSLSHNSCSSHEGTRMTLACNFWKQRLLGCFWHFVVGSRSKV